MVSHARLGESPSTELDDELRAYVRGVSRSLARGDLSLADDIEQETFTVALQHRPRDPRATRAWLRAVARSCASIVRGRPGRRPKTVAYNDPAHSPSRDGASMDPAEAVLRAELRRTLDRALAKLPEHYARVISLRVLDGLPPREIAAVMDVPVNTVRTWTRRGFEKLRADVDDLATQESLDEPKPLFGLAFLALPRARALALAAGVALVACGVFVAGGFRGERVGAGDVVRSGALDPGAAVDGADTGGAGRRGPASSSPVTAEIINDDVADEPTAGFRVAVTVVTAEGAPASDVDIFEHAGFRGAVRHIARTDERGRATVYAEGTNRWVAARGEPGFVSDAVLLGQPFVRGPRALTLTLDEVPVAWVDVDLSARPDLEDPAVGRTVDLEGIPVDARHLCQRGLGEGLRGASCWLPGWHDAAGRIGVTWDDLEKSLCVLVDGHAIWTDGPYSIGARAPEVISVGRPWTLRGRLVSLEGLPIADKALRFETGLNETKTAGGAITDENGAFEVKGLSLTKTHVRAYGLSSRSFQRPAGDLLDVGAVVLDEDLSGLQVHGRVVDAPGPFFVQAVTQDTHGTPMSIRMAVDGFETRLPLPHGDGRFVLEEAEERVRAIVVSGVPGGPAMGQTIVPRPEGGWPREGVEIHLDDEPPGRLVCAAREALLPARLTLVHADNGFRSVHVLDREDSTFESPWLSAGTWAVYLQDRLGRYAPCARVQLEPGQVLDLGDLEPHTGRVRFNWPAAFVDPASEGVAGGAGVYIVLRQGNDFIVRKRFSATALVRELGEIELPVGRYHMLAHFAGRNYEAAFEIANGRTQTCSPEDGQRTVVVKLPESVRREAAPDARLELIAEDGRVLESIDLAGLAAPGMLLDQPGVEFVFDAELAVVVELHGAPVARSEAIGPSPSGAGKVLIDWSRPATTSAARPR